MATLDHVENMYDVKLKPRLLRSLIHRHLPDQDRAFPENADLAIVVRELKTFRLLSESFPDGVNAEVIHDWKLAVDDWVYRLILLSSDQVGAKSWAGSILLGLTCLECSSNRFLASYSVWFDELLSRIHFNRFKWNIICGFSCFKQPPSDYESVNVASCSSISNLLGRLGGYSNLKKDGTIHAGKLIQPILNLLDKDCSEAELEGAVDLLCTIITCFPSSIRCKYESAQAAIVSTIISGRYGVNVLKKFAHCLALLPKSRGDEDSWSVTVEKILISIDVLLNEAFEGVQEETSCFGAISLLVPPREDPLDPLGGLTMSDILSNLARIRSKQLLVSSIPTLMLCCCIMLTNPYPVQVTVPVCPLLTLVGRVLMADGSLCQGLLPLTTILRQESICFALPILHSYSLDLLTAIIKGVRSQLSPHAVDIVQLLTEYFRRCALPTLRIKVYSIVRILLISMGVGIALHIAQDVISNAFTDLDSVTYGSGMESSSVHSKSTTEAFLEPSNRKNKHDTTIGPLEEDLDGEGLEVETCKENPTLTSLKIAALEALEALLTVGGALRCERLQSDVDLLLINVATSAFDVEWTSEEDCDFVPLNEPSFTWKEFQLAALRALLASLLTPSQVPPRYLYQGLELFRKGKQEMGTKVAEFSAHALLALELLMRPRYIPLVDSPSASQSYFNEGINQGVPENPYSGSRENDAPISTAMDNLPDQYDDLDDSWLGDGNETEAHLTNPNENFKNTGRPSTTDVQQAIKDFNAENCPMDGSSGAIILEENKQGQAVGINVEMGINNDEIIVEQEQFAYPILLKDVKVPTGTLTGSEFKFQKVD